MGQEQKLARMDQKLAAVDEDVEGHDNILENGIGIYEVSAYEVNRPEGPYRLGGSSLLLLWALLTGSYVLIISSDGPLVAKEDWDSSSSKSSRGSFMANASLEACRRPLLIVERNTVRISFVTNRPSADGTSRKAMVACVDAAQMFVVLYARNKNCRPQGVLLMKRHFLIGQPHKLPWSIVRPQS
jgi:hypothetical protein